jgi:replicative DNA helicase
VTATEATHLAIGTPDGGMAPVHNLHAEQAVLGAILLSGGAVIGDIEPIMSGRDFYRPAHEQVWDAMMGLWGRGAPIDPTTIVDALNREGTLSRVGGPTYLHTLVSTTPSAASAAYYATIVRDLAVSRRLAAAGTAIHQLGSSMDGGDIDTVIAEAHAHLASVAAGLSDGAAVNFGQHIDDVLGRIDTPSDDSAGLTWGWTDLDKMLRPAQPGQLIIVSARPGAGKSTFARCWALHVAGTLRRRVLLHPLEQGREETEDALISAASGVPLARIDGGNLTDDDWAKIARARRILDGADIIIDDSPVLTLPGLRASIRRHRPDVVMIDQIQHMTPPPGAGKREEAVAALSTGIKLAARAEGVPILVVSKMNRGPEQRTDKKPQVSDLRESGNLESDADVILLLHREDMYEKETSRAGEVDIIIGKQRRGAQDTVTLAAQLHYQRFVSLAS